MNFSINTILFRFAPLFIGVLIISCNGEEEQNHSVFDALDFPEVNYEMGKVEFLDLFSQLVSDQENSELSIYYERLVDVRVLFEADSGVKSMEHMMILMADFLEDQDTLSVATDLLESEMYYQMTRSFFYERNEVFIPTCVLLEKGMELSKNHINSSDSLVQQIAMFQLARHFDVMEGMTNGYASFIQPLEKEELTFASMNSLTIKRDALGIKGGPVIRSLSNLRTDYARLCDFGNMDACNNKIPDINQEAFEHFKYLDEHSHLQYGEFISTTLSQIFKFSINQGDNTLAKKAMEHKISLFFENPCYNLGDSLPSFKFGAGVSHHPYMAISMLNTYIDSTGEHQYSWLKKAVGDSIQVMLNRQFENSEKPTYAAIREISVVEEYKNPTGIKDDSYPINGSLAYKYLDAVYRRWSLQESKELAKSVLLENNPSLELFYDSLYHSQDDFRITELQLADNLSSENFRNCAKSFKHFKDLTSRSNKLLNEDLFEPDYLSLEEIQDKLEEDEVWITFFQSALASESFTISVVNNEEIIVEKIFKNELLHDKETSVKSAMGYLEKVIMNNGDWNEKEAQLLSEISKRCFGNSIKKDNQHIIISTLAYPVSRIWEAMLHEIANSNDTELNSIRYDHQYFYDRKDFVVPGPSSWIAIAPKFEVEEEDVILDDESRKDLVSKLRGAKNKKLENLFNSSKNSEYSPIFHNIKEVTKIQKRLKGLTLIGENASEAKFVKQDLNNAILHFATHAFIDERDVYRSGIIMNGNNFGKGTGTNDNILFAHEIRKLKINAELVVLSACETGISPKRNGAYDWSLGRAFTDAGCRNTITSLYNIDDKATYDIIVSFYEELLAGKGKAEALYAAKQKYIDIHKEQNPYYWLPLILTGDNLPVEFDQ